MPRPVLLAWELGAGQGHVLRLTAIARALASRGIETVYAVQRLDALPVAGEFEGGGHFQAPIWPGLLGRSDAGPPGRQATLGDTLADLGLRHRATMERLLSGWDTIFLHLRPAAVVADFSPACLVAAQGRIPSLATGTGYTLPPAAAPRFALLRSDRPERKYDEQLLLDAVNGAIRASGRELDRLPAIFSADRIALTAFAETDPYGAERTTPYLAPFLPSWCATPDTGGEEIFVYFPEHLTTNAAIIGALENVARAGKPLRIYSPRLESEIAQRLSAAGIFVEPDRVPLDAVSRRSRLIVSHGGYGTAAFALAAGIPQIIVAYDTEKLLTGQAVERLGVGRCLQLQKNNPLEAALLAQSILEAAENETLTAQARRLAPDFVRRLARDPAEEIAEDVESLLKL